MNLKSLANQVFLRAKNERSNERDVNADEKKRSFSFLGMNAEMNAKKPAPPPSDPVPNQGTGSPLNSDPRPFHTDGRELDPASHGDAWLCPDCGQPVAINDVFLAQDGERTLTMWSCEPCGVVAVTPDAVQEPPADFQPSTFDIIKATSPVSFHDPSLDPTTPPVLVAAWWLEDHALPQPRRVGEVLAEWTGGVQRLQRNGSLRWEGGRDGTDGHWMTDLCEAREHLGITAFVGDDGLMWWTCPERTSLDLMWIHKDVLLAQRKAA